MKGMIVELVFALIALITAAPRAGADPLSDALGSCAPGMDFDGCVAELRKLGLKANVSMNVGPAKVVGTNLITAYGQYGFWEFEAPKSQDDPAFNKIILAKLGWAGLPPRQRRALIDWFGNHLKSAVSVSDHWSSENSCGYPKTGPAWASLGVYDPEIFFALSGVPWLTPPKGKSIETVFEKTKVDEVAVCFTLPFDGEQREYLEPKFTNVYLDFIRTSPLATAVRPINGRPKLNARP